MSSCNLYNCEHSGRAHGDSDSTIMTMLCCPQMHSNIWVLTLVVCLPFANHCSLWPSWICMMSDTYALFRQPVYICAMYACIYGLAWSIFLKQNVQCEQRSRLQYPWSLIRLNPYLLYCLLKLTHTYYEYLSCAGLWFPHSQWSVSQAMQGH